MKQFKMAPGDSKRIQFPVSKYKVGDKIQVTVNTEDDWQYMLQYNLSNKEGDYMDSRQNESGALVFDVVIEEEWYNEMLTLIIWNLGKKSMNGSYVEV